MLTDKYQKHIDGPMSGEQEENIHHLCYVGIDT